MLLLDELQDYMLTARLIQKSITSVVDESKIKQEESNKILVPREKDTLFWCFYIMRNGDINYEMIQQQNVNIFVTEKKLKIDYVERLRKEKHLVKQHKFVVISEIENQLANESKINLETFLTLCIIEKINILYVNSNKTYFELKCNTDDETTHIMRRLDNKHTSNYQTNSYFRFGYEGSCITKANTYRTSLYKMEDIKKPLKSLASYKISELTSISHKLGMNIETAKINKKELYEKLNLFFF
jgi:hypothetical protein